MNLYYQKWMSPTGPVHLVATSQTLIVVAFDANWSEHRDRLPGKPVKESNSILKLAIKQLTEYFDGKRRAFDLPLEPQGTRFQVDAWNALLKIPYGETRSYGEQAKAIRKPLAVRAIGLANSRNPISIIIPCHRVVGSSGRLTGYSGGLSKKRRLLDHEKSKTN